MITAQAEDVARVIGNALLHTSKDATMPVLAAVRVECEAGTLTAVGTDRYSLGTDTARVEAGEDAFAFLLAREDAARVVKLCKDHAKTYRHTVAYVEITVSERTLTLSVPGQTITATCVDGEFPRYRGLIPSAQDLAESPGTNHTAFAPANLAKFTKITAPRTAPVRFYVRAADKPAVVRVGETFLGILMPVRVAWTCDAPNTEPDKSWQGCTHNEGHTGDHSWHRVAVAS